MTGEDTKICRKSIGNKNVKKETMLSTFNKHINKSDFEYIEYSIGSSKNESIRPLNEILCDDKIVFTPIENRYLFKLNDKIEREIDIKHFPRELLGKTKAMIKFAFNYIGLSLSKQQNKPTRNKYFAKKYYINRSSDYIQRLKIDLDQFLSDKFLRFYQTQKF